MDCISDDFQWINLRFQMVIFNLANNYHYVLRVVMSCLESNACAPVMSGLVMPLMKAAILNAECFSHSSCEEIKMLICLPTNSSATNYNIIYNDFQSDNAVITSRL